MGCAASQSQPSYRPENRPKELHKCAAISSDVRWAWLQGRTLFTFAELRVLLKLYQTATASGANRVVGSGERPSDPELAPPYTAAPSFTTTEAGESLSGKESSIGTMNKGQFLAACKLDEAFRLLEVVGTFGSRLFDVLDRNGNGELEYEDFAIGISTLLKGPESEKLKLMYAAYDLSGVGPGGRQRRGRHRAGKKLARGSKFLTMEDMAAVLTSASEDAYPTLLTYTTRKHSGTEGAGLDSSQRGKGDPGNGKSLPRAESDESPPGSGQEEQPSDSGDSPAGSGAACSRTRGPNPKALEEALKELARRNAASFAERAVAEFGQAHEGMLTPKEFERWASTGPVLRCRLHEFSLDVNVVPFQGVRMA